MKSVNISIIIYVIVRLFGLEVNAFHAQKSCYFCNFSLCSIHGDTVLYASPPESKDNGLWKGMINLWDEIIEVSTYGPSERKMLKAQRERKLQVDKNYLPVQQKEKEDDKEIFDQNFESDDDIAWVKAFSAAKAAKENDRISSEDLNYDGYSLRDMLVSKWGVPLDVDFQKIGDSLYCTVLPLVGFGSPLRSRHDSELDYLMHLQGVVEVLHKYDNLDAFITYIEETKKAPKRGTDSIPVRLILSEKDMRKILLQD